MHNRVRPSNFWIQDSKGGGGNYTQDFRGVFTPRILGGPPGF